MEASFAEDSCQMQEELAELLGVTQQAISKRLKAMGMIQYLQTDDSKTKRSKS